MTTANTSLWKPQPPRRRYWPAARTLDSHHQPRSAPRRRRVHLQHTVVARSIGGGNSYPERGRCRRIRSDPPLRQSRRSCQSHFAITDDNAPTVADLCRRLDGIPLAIELAAARVNVLPVKSIVEKLTDRFRILTGCERTALPRQHTMRATIDWSYDLLSAPERKLFELLSVFAGGFTLGAATNVCAADDVAEGDVLDLLWSLVISHCLLLIFSQANRATTFSNRSGSTHLRSLRQTASETS